jgi:hypothetical protein
MKIRKDQIISLWEQRISAYIHKKSIETRKLILFLGMFMFLISGDAQFGKNVTVFMGLGYGIYITLHSLITRKIKKLSSLQLKEEKERTFKVLLLSVQNWSFVGVLTGTSWLAGGLGVKQMLGDIFNNRTLSFSLISLFILASVFFPFILHNKAKEKKKDDFKYYPQLIAFSTAAPGIGLFIAAIIPNVRRVSTQFFLYVFFMSLAGIIMLPYFVWGLYEILVLGLRKWPDIKKTNSEYRVSFPDDKI